MRTGSQLRDLHGFIMRGQLEWWLLRHALCEQRVHVRAGAVASPEQQVTRDHRGRRVSKLDAPSNSTSSRSQPQGDAEERAPAAEVDIVSA